MLSASITVMHCSPTVTSGRVGVCVNNTSSTFILLHAHYLAPKTQANMSERAKEETGLEQWFAGADLRHTRNAPSPSTCGGTEGLR